MAARGQYFPQVCCIPRVHACAPLACDAQGEGGVRPSPLFSIRCMAAITLPYDIRRSKYALWTQEEHAFATPDIDASRDLPFRVRRVSLRRPAARLTFFRVTNSRLAGSMFETVLHARQHRSAACTDEARIIC